MAVGWSFKLASDKRPRRRAWAIHPRLAVLYLLVCFVGSGLAQDDPSVSMRMDPEKIKTAKTCRRCHVSTYNVWEHTTHATGFKTLHRNPAAQEIAEKMGFALIKRESLCLECHYTPEVKRDTLRAESGVSCESCHGPAGDWFAIHNDYGKGATYETETPEHKAQRIAETRRLGMRRPSDLYEIAARCFQCHTVPQEKLVNVGGHGTGSANFEYVAWSQGELRHNFLQSFLTGDGTVNMERSQERKRIMYVLGRALDVEYSLRGVAVAREQQRYFKGMSRRLRVAINELRTIERLTDIEQLTEIIALVRAAKVVPDNQAALTRDANQIAGLTKAFLASAGERDLAVIDPLLRGEPVDLPEEEPLASHVLPRDEVANAAAETGTEPNASEASTPVATSAAVREQPQQPSWRIEGEFKTRLRPTSPHETIGPGECNSCHRHEAQSTWWFDDVHYRSADPFFAAADRPVEIATRYGISANRLTRGDSVCMDCHGTVVSGRENREISDGVGCEACHGPAADYLEPHREGEPELGPQRPGYVKALTLGMNKMSDAAVRARVCSDCHYITDKRLLSAGHRSGKDFDPVAAMAKIEHWEKATLTGPAIAEGYAKVLTSRGPVPKVKVWQPPKAQPKTEVARARPVTVKPLPQKSEPKPKVVRPDVPKPRPVDPLAIPQADPNQALDLPPFPVIDEDTPVEEVLLILKQRLDLLFQRVQGGNQ